ncbi:MAG: hypothetical protein GY903_08615 [Fuerstiella sp.]|nr:hypothetical protein [Fuerstiella sp.]
MPRIEVSIEVVQFVRLIDTLWEILITLNGQRWCGKIVFFALTFRCDVGAPIIESKTADTFYRSRYQRDRSNRTCYAKTNQDRVPTTPPWCGRSQMASAA